jgi:hypothetical protein
MASMGRKLRTTWTGALLLLAAGCMTGPSLENPVFVRPDPNVHVANPVWIPGAGQPTYYNEKVFETVLDVVDDYFEIRYANRYDGHIETFPRISPGYEQFWKPGSPDAYQRLEATLQTIRHRGEVFIEPAQDGGYFIRVLMFKELEDLPRPIRATAGAAAFRSDPTVERQYEVIEPTFFESNWIPVGPDGRDHELEQAILQRLKKCL